MVKNQNKTRGYQGEDRRWFTRFRTNFPVQVKDLEENSEKKVALRDISARGVGVTTQDKLTLDKKLEVCLFIPDSHEPLHLKGQVVWLKEEQLGKYRVGIKFERINLVSLSRIFRLTD